MTSEMKLEPAADEIERVAKALCTVFWGDDTYWDGFRISARAAILAMDRRVSPPAEPVAPAVTGPGLWVSPGDVSLMFSHINSNWRVVVCSLSTEADAERLAAAISSLGSPQPPATQSVEPTKEMIQAGLDDLGWERLDDPKLNAALEAAVAGVYRAMRAAAIVRPCEPS